VFDDLAKIGKGAGGEIQLTDGIARLMQREPIYAFEFEGKRYDCGNKLGYLQATVEFGLKHRASVRTSPPTSRNSAESSRKWPPARTGGRRSARTLPLTTGLPRVRVPMLPVCRAVRRRGNYLHARPSCGQAPARIGSPRAAGRARVGVLPDVRTPDARPALSRTPGSAARVSPASTPARCRAKVRSRPTIPAIQPGQRPRTARSSDAVNIILRHVGQLVVHHLRQLLDVEPRAATSVATSAVICPRLNISSAFTRAAWLLLPWIAAAWMPAPSICWVRRFAPCLVRGEDEHLMPVAGTDQMHEQMTLLLLLYPVGALLDELDWRIARRDLDRERITQQPLRESRISPNRSPRTASFVASRAAA